MKNYEKTITYQQAKQIFFLTQDFTQKFLNEYKDRRLIEQMISSARSIKQNLSEGATRNSIKDYIQFIGFSRASGEELLEDYKDLAELWKIKVVRPSLSSLPSLSSSRSETVNQMIDLVARNNYLEDQQRRSLEKHFITHGGYTENLAKKRRIHRGY
ncbi:four helix bundle protein [Patescibacteria group bacterium]|nr:four helix bundle protein [Patescibacteria group bacterium]